jgi:hypothetical protein
MEEIDPEQMAPRRPISFKARDGLVLHGFLTMPPTRPAPSCRWCCCRTAARSALPTTGSSTPTPSSSPAAATPSCR